jgi:dUTP pyrophosphatase
MILEYKKRENAKSPMRANPSDAGLDVFYCPADPNVSAARLDPGENQLFSTGLRFGVPHGYMLQVCNRSSMGAKRSLIVGAHIIDSGYDGEIFIDLHNIGKETQFVSTGDKIAQLILVPVVHFRALETKEENLYSEPITISNRGDGALGSTDKRAAPSTAQADMADRHGLNDIIRKGWLPNGF